MVRYVAAVVILLWPGRAHHRHVEEPVRVEAIPSKAAPPLRRPSTPRRVLPAAEASGKVVVKKELVLLAAHVLVVEDDRALRPESDGGGSCGELTEDHRGVLQVMDVIASQRHWSRSETLAKMAPRVAGERETSDGRVMLFRSLPAELEPLSKRTYVPPLLWTDANGPWDLYGPCWANFVKNVRQALRHGYEAPCDGIPVAEGGPMDDHYAEERGLVRMPCGERLHFWRAP